MNLAILGGGISGMLAAYVFRSAAQVQLFEAGPSLGGTYTQGGLKYVRETEEFKSLLGELDVPYKLYQPVGGLLQTLNTAAATVAASAAKLQPHPEFLKGLSAGERMMWQMIHWMKTRGSLEGFKSTCMNDPSGGGDDPALAFDHKEFFIKLEAALRLAGVEIITSAKATRVAQGWVEIDGKGSFPFTRMLTTLPLPLMARLALWAGLPTTANTAHLTVAFFDALPKWLDAAVTGSADYAYTPLLNGVHRISKVEGGWQAEAAGKVAASVFEASLGTPEDPLKIRALVTMPGHLLPLEKEPTWPEQIAPIGRYAEWNSRATAETVLDRALALRSSW